MNQPSCDRSLQRFCDRLPELPASPDLNEARSRIPVGTPEEWERFTLRQWRARLRLTRLLAFYGECPSIMSRTHLLAACAIVLGRFCGYSAAFDEIGEALMPVTTLNIHRTPLWADYAAACRAGQPWQLREERWLAAHMADMEQVRARGLAARFATEAEAHPNDPTWSLLGQHMEVVVGQRALDAAALNGMVAYETAMSVNLAHGVRRLLTAGLRLLLRYAAEATRALVRPEALQAAPHVLRSGTVAAEGDPPARSSNPVDAGRLSQAPSSARQGTAGDLPPLLCGDRRCALLLIYYAVTAWSAAAIFRRGVRQRDRGRQADSDGWPLLEEALGERVTEVHPLILRFYRNPAPFQVRASLRLHTLPARLASRLATLLTGQGLYEEAYSEIEAHFRIFRRADGSMHFLRELLCGGTLRVFDSDFVVRDRDGRPTLTEVFPDLNLAMEMHSIPGPYGTLTLRSTRVLWHGIAVPTFGLTVEFHSHVAPATDDGIEVLTIEGFLRLLPRSRWGRFVAYTLLRRPATLGAITYVVRQIREIREAGTCTRRDSLH